MNNCISSIAQFEFIEQDNNHVENTLRKFGVHIILWVDCKPKKQYSKFKIFCDFFPCDVFFLSNSVTSFLCDFFPTFR